MGEKVPTRIHSLEKALCILEAFTPEQPSLTLTQISSIVNIPKSTALNFIRTFEDANYLRKVPNSQFYQLGYKALHLGYCMRSSLPIIQYALPMLESLQIASNEIIYLTTTVDGLVLYLDSVFPSKHLINYSVSGRTLHMHCNACGKAMLSHMPREEVDRIIAQWGLPKFTDKTITDAQTLYENLALSYQRGYALDLEERRIGTKCIGMAICKADGEVVGSVSISAPSRNMSDERMESFLPMLTNVTRLLSQYADSFPVLHMGGTGGDQAGNTAL